MSKTTVFKEGQWRITFNPSGHFHRYQLYHRCTPEDQYNDIITDGEFADGRCAIGPCRKVIPKRIKEIVALLRMGE